ncbi:MAG: hypothetical protein K5785_10240, partial [Nitrosarchaeum sp.]|nr:hypothetical protein [Nitrosarchaeum sp.]
NSTSPDLTNSTSPDLTNSTSPDLTNSTSPDLTNSTSPDLTNSTITSSDTDVQPIEIPKDPVMSLNFENHNNSTNNTSINQGNNTTVKLDGSTNFIKIENQSNTNTLPTFTISAWVKPNYSQGSSEFTVVSKEKSFSLSVNNILKPNHIAKFGVFDGVKWTYVESNVVIPEEWTHISATFGSGIIEIYVNGIYQNSNTVTGLPSLSINGKLETTTIDSIKSEKEIVIGAYITSKSEIDNPSSRFSGEIDNVELFDSKLTQQQLSLIYESNKDSFTVVPELSLEEILAQIEAEQLSPSNQTTFTNDTTTGMFEQLPISNQTLTNGTTTETSEQPIEETSPVDTLILSEEMEANITKQESEIKIFPEILSLDKSYTITDDVIFDLEFYDEYDALMLELSKIDSATELLLAETEQNLIELEHVEVSQAETTSPLGFLFGLQRFLPIQIADAAQADEIDELRIALTDAKLKLEQLKLRTDQLKTQTPDEKTVKDLKAEFKQTIQEIKQIITKLQKSNLSSQATGLQTIADSAENLGNVKAAEKQNGKWSDDRTDLVADVYDINGNKANLNVEYEKIRDGKFSVKLSPTTDTKPGLYKVVSTFTVNGVEHTTESEFAWGLVSLNSKKSIYKPGEIADFVIVVLDSEGRPIDNAELFMTITNPDNQITTLSSQDGITAGSETGLYETRYQTTDEGTYNIEIHAAADGIDTDFATTFDVASFYEFDIVRTAQSKIDPINNPNSFDVKIDIESFTSQDSIIIIETVPKVFDVITDAKITVDGNRKVLTWEKRLNDSKTSVGYSYAVPLEFPQLYPLGPIQIKYDTQTFTEARSWFVANDPANLSNSSTTTCTAVASGGTCTITAWDPSGIGGTNRLLVVVATLDSDGNIAPSIASVNAGTNGGSTTAMNAYTGATITSEGGNDHVVAIYYLREVNWGNFNISTANDIILTTGTSAGDVTLTAFILSDIDQTSPTVGTPVSTSGGNWPATNSYTASSTTNVVVAAAIAEGTGQTESTSNLTNIASSPADTNQHVHMVGINVTPPTSATTYGWTGGSGKQSNVVVEFNDAPATPIYQINSLDVYQSSSTTLNSGTAVCTGVSQTSGSAQTCTGNLQPNTTYRFEVNVGNTGTGAGSPNTFSFLNSVGANDILGSSPSYGSAGCGTNTNWSAGTSGSNVVVNSGTTCSISASGNQDYWFIVTIGSDTRGDTTQTFSVSDGTVSDSSNANTIFSVLKTTSRSDSVSITDTASFAITKTLSDSMTVSDTIVTSAAQTKTLSDSMTVSDTIVTSAAQTKTLSDSMTVSDTIVTSAAQTKTLSDSVSLTDTASFAITKTL